jgi:3'-5' exonuclease
MNFNNILYLDIETVSQSETYNHLGAEWKDLWDLKASVLNRNREEETSETAYQRAGIYAEFGKVICISCGYMSGSGEDRKLTIKSYYNEDEKALLMEFCNVLNNWGRDNDRLADEDKKFLCAHNGREFDYPYLCRRMIINKIALPDILKLQGKKPWQICHYDTMELWKFGDYKSYTSLKLLARVLGIPSPKDDIDGSQVHSVYWVEKDLRRIVEYCQKDVITLAQVMLRFYCEPQVKTENINFK